MENLKFLTKYWCGKSRSCLYSTNKLFNLKRHESSCRDHVKVKYKEQFYGTNQNVRKELIELGVLKADDNNMAKFVTWDIESFNSPRSEKVGESTIIYGKQEVVSIAISCNFSGSGNYFFIRRSMDHLAGVTLVQLFLEKLNDLSEDYYCSLPSKIKDYYDQAKLESSLVRIWKIINYVKIIYH